MRRTAFAITGVLLLGLILILVNGLSKTVFSSAYLDLTEEGLYSLSQGSKNIVSNLKEPITLNYYFSRTEAAHVPAIMIFGRRVSDLLREYQRLSNGKITLNVYDPRPDTEEEEWAQKFGLSPIPLRTGEQIFFGLAGRNSTGAELAIPVFDTALNASQQQFLEYEISQLISTLAQEKKPEVGLLSTLDVRGVPENPMMGGGTPPWYFVQQLSEQADVTFVDAKAGEIDPKIELLVVVHPKTLPVGTQYAIDQFVMRGGKLVVLEDPFCEADRPQQDEQNPMMQPTADRGSSLNRLTKAWGVELNEKRVVADINLATPVSAGPQGMVKRFILWLRLTRANVASADVITARLESMILPWAGTLTVKPLDGVEYTTLLKTTKEAMLLKPEQPVDGMDPDFFLKNYSPGHEELPIAVRIHGKLKSAFPEGKPEVSEDEAKEGAPKPSEGEQLTESKTEADVVIVGDVDFLSDRYSITVQNLLGARMLSRLNDNQGFFENVVDNLRGSSDLIGIRSRGQFSRDFTRVRALEQKAQERFRDEETILQSKLENANRRLNEIQNAEGGKGGERALDRAFMDELRQVRDEKLQAQRRLREVRRNLREDIERLGNRLFFMNTFLVPLLLIVGTSLYVFRKGKTR